MRKIWLIIKREYVTRVRTKAFLLSTIGLPLFTTGIFAFSIFMATHQPEHTLRIAILDQVGGLAAEIARGLRETLPNGQPAFEVVKTEEQPGLGREGELRAMVRKGQLDAYLLLSREVGEDKAAAEFHTKNPGMMTMTGSIEHAVSDAVIARRLEKRGIRLGDVSRLVRGVDVKVIKVTEQGESEEKGQTFVAAIMLGTLLYITLIVYGVATMRSVMEEKTTRIVEILVSAVKPFHLLCGKILGVAAVALTQYLIWGVTAALFAAYGKAMVSAFRPGASLPQVHLPLMWLFYIVVLFLSGYLLYASLYAAAGAMVSTEQEAQLVQAPMTMVILVSFLLFNVILHDPDSTASTVLSLVPFLSPILMMLRIAIQTPPLWQIVLALGLSVVTTLAVVQFSARIYRVGILTYGKRPSLVEVLRWLRYT